MAVICYVRHIILRCLIRVNFFFFLFFLHWSYKGSVGAFVASDFVILMTERTDFKTIIKYDFVSSVSYVQFLNSEFRFSIRINIIDTMSSC